MRKKKLTLCVSLLGFMVTGLIAAAAGQATNRLDRVNVVQSTDDIRVEISARGTLTPQVSTLDSPARVVVDLPETAKATTQTRIAVGASGVKGVRIGTDGLSHPTTRIVVDLEQACAYDLSKSAAGQLVLTLHSHAVAKAAAESTTVAASAPVPAEHASSPFALRPTDAQAKSETVPATKVLAKDAAPTDYVVVEPTYQTASNKNSSSNPAATTDEPSVRAQEAAARFADKTAAELVTVSEHSAQSQSQAPAITPAVNMAAEQKSMAAQQPANA